MLVEGHRTIVASYAAFGMIMPERNFEPADASQNDPIIDSAYVLNEQFDDTTLTGWILTNDNASFHTAGGFLVVDAFGPWSGCQKTFATEPGKTYRVRFLATASGYPILTVQMPDFGPYYYSGASVDYTFTASSTTATVLVATTYFADEFYVDYVSFQKMDTVQQASSGYAKSKYRFAFNGKEKVDEPYGNGNMYDYGFRIYNPRLGKFLSVDPLTKSYPWYTPYQFAGNKPIWASDLDGLEEKFETEKGYSINATYVATLEVLDNVDIECLSETINAVLNSNITMQTPNGPHSPTNNPQVEFNIHIYKKLPRDEVTGQSRIYTDDGKYSLGGRIKMGTNGDFDDDYIDPDENGNIKVKITPAAILLPGNDIVLNPKVFDKSNPDYQSTKKFLELSTGVSDYNENYKYRDIAHEIGHDMGLSHKGGYPSGGLMSNKGDRIPTQEEVNTIISPSNERIIQPQ